MKTIKEMVSNGKTVRFAYYHDLNLWYVTECGFEFPVPIEDIGTATFLNEDRAMLFMRYIRKHLDVIAAGKQEQAT
jgi:hypothetical protein